MKRIRYTGSAALGMTSISSFTLVPSGQVIKVLLSKPGSLWSFSFVDSSGTQVFSDDMTFRSFHVAKRFAKEKLIEMGVSFEKDTRIRSSLADITISDVA